MRSSRRTAKATGRSLLAQFLKANRLTREQAAAAVGVSKTAVIYWLQGKQVPEHPRRLAIELWTSGAVPAASWESDDERRMVAGVRPFTPPPPEAA